MMELDRRHLLGLGLGATVLGPARALEAEPRRDWNLVEVTELGLRGQGFADTASPYDRLPAKAESLVRPPVWKLSRHASGLHVDFETDAVELRLEIDLSEAKLEMPHMPASGASGADLYAREEAGSWRWVSCVLPGRQQYAAELRGLRPGKRTYRLYLPLYNGVVSARIGVREGAELLKVPVPERPAFVYYGTSIAQGACASRPGMSFVNILGRRMDEEVVNLAFSGNGKLEPEVGDLLVELDPGVYVLDCLPNLGPAEVAARTEPFVRRLREARPETPIVMVEDRMNANAPFYPARARHHAGNHSAFRAAHEALIGAGIEGLTYVPDAPFLGTDGEATVDGSHPTDLGMVRYADALEPILRDILGSR